MAQAELNQYLEIAAENNPELKARYAEFEASLEKIPQAKTLQDPTLSIGYFISPVETRVGPQRVRFSLSQMFPWFGTLDARGDVAALQAKANYLKFINARGKLFQMVKGQYYEIWEVQKLMELEQKNLALLDSYEKLAQTRFSSGEGRLANVLRVQLEQQQVKTQLKILQNRMEPLKASFERLINQQVQPEIVIADSIPVKPLHEYIRPDTLPAHPVVQFYQLQQQASGQSKRVAIKSGYPNLGAGLDYVVVDKRTDMSMSDNGKNVIMPMVTIGLPIWRKKYNAAVKEAELREEQFQFEQENAINTFLSQLDIAYYQLQVAQDQMDLFRSEIEISNKTLELSISDYTNNLSDFEEVLQIQQKLIQFERGYYTAYKNYLLMMSDIEYLTYEVSEEERNN
ncbi:Heavy metal RND efflux outer membrane protein, CzcC family [Fulvivirga imtechensis AK7]|uniref:Heavy metal RND efflux outer membrane protein, CzcC family n=2 Tax=Fulvivirga TaxID=396811 RepID=L8JZL7_9BACT|nr:Heavy metal RND efflux outer membrane protein, CzcC family [Fulvivirga imtechensis AK7]